MYLGSSNQNGDMMFNRLKLPNSCEEKILGVIIGSELKDTWTDIEKTVLRKV